jgi:MFS family permease
MFTALLKALRLTNLDPRPSIYDHPDALAISYFYPIPINGMGYTSTMAQYMTAPSYLVSVIFPPPVFWFADWNPNRRGILLVTNLVVGMVFFALTAEIRNYTGR